jgi:hypothetical protein
MTIGLQEKPTTPIAALPYQVGSNPDGLAIVAGE